MKEQILQLRSQGLTHRQIADELGCAKSTVCYHLSDNQRLKNTERRRKERAKLHPFARKLENYKSRTHNPIILEPKHKWQKLFYLKVSKFIKGNNMSDTSERFTIDDVINKFGTNPVCYLTGLPIDITKPRTYHFDHIIPSSKGGPNTIDNLGICTKEANQAKSNMSLEDFVSMCKMIVDRHCEKPL